MLCLKISVARREDKERLRVNRGVYKTLPVGKAEKRGYGILGQSECLAKRAICK